MNKLKEKQTTWNTVLLICIVVFHTTLVISAPLTMGFGKNLNLMQNDAYTEQAFDLDIFSYQNHFQEKFKY